MEQLGRELLIYGIYSTLLLQLLPGKGYEGYGRLAIGIWYSGMIIRLLREMIQWILDIF